MKPRKRLKALRIKRNLTQQQLGAEIGATDMAVNHWEAGRRLPRPATIGPLARALGISIPELLDLIYL